MCRYIDNLGAGSPINGMGAIDFGTNCVFVAVFCPFPARGTHMHELCIGARIIVTFIRYRPL